MLTNKVKGCLYGYAIGDALGLGTEFMTRKEVKYRYPDGLTDYGQIIRDAHRSLWKQGQFSHDTEQIIMIAQSITDCNGPDHLDFTVRLKKWFDSSEPSDLGAHFRWVMMRDDFIDNPFKASKETYEYQRLFESHNEALGRALILGMWPHNFEHPVINHTKITHWDPLSSACGLVVAATANMLLWHGGNIDFDYIISLSRHLDHRLLPYLEVARDGELSDFELDDEDTIWSAPKSTGASLWVLNHFKDPLEALNTIIAEGGDADTNAALSLGLLGLKYGFDKLPMNLIEGLLDAERIDSTSEALIPVLAAANHNSTL